MPVIVDTCVWSLALRRRPESLAPEQRALVEEVARLTRSQEIVLPGPIRQELLTGIRDPRAFDALERQLRQFPEEPILPSDYTAAARLTNQCLASGLTPGPVDVLLCAIAIRLAVPILTTDADFPRFAQIIPVRVLGRLP